MVGRDEAELRETGAPDDLWRFLVTRPGGPELHPSVAVELFERHHSGGEPGAVDTALLLCTDWRWRRSSADVLAGILRAGILDDAEQDDLAERLLWPERVNYVHPTGWLGTSSLEIELPAELSKRLRTRRVRIDPAQPMKTPRHVWPPARRWAATRLLIRCRAEPVAVIELARSLPAPDAAAVITGAAQAAAHLPTEPAHQVVEAALGWGHKSARKAALERLCYWGEQARAIDIAMRDPDASLRQWATKQQSSSQPALFG